MGNSKDNMRRETAQQDAQIRNAACFVFFVFLGVVIVLFASVFPNHRRNCKLVAKRANLENGKVELAERNEHLRREIVALRSDRLYIEAIAREKYKLVNPGEVLIDTCGDSD